MKKLLGLISILAGLSIGATQAYASSSAKTVFDGVYPGNSITCFVCHTGTPGSLTAYGTQYVSNGGTAAGLASAINAIDTLDADNDGTTNGDAIRAGTDPNGNTTTTNTETASVFGCLTGAMATPLTMMLVMLTLGFLIRRKV